MKKHNFEVDEDGVCRWRKRLVKFKPAPVGYDEWFEDHPEYKCFLVDTDEISK